MNTNIHNATETIDYKDFKIKEFRNYLYKCIEKSPLKKNERDDKKFEIQGLIVEHGGDNFTGKMFYVTLKHLDQDIDLACENLFHDYNYPGIKQSYEGMNKFSVFVSGICLNDADIASAIGASGSRISRIRNSTDETDFYPFQVYALAKISGILSNQLFEYFYGNGKRPIVGIAPSAENHNEGTE